MSRAEKLALILEPGSPKPDVEIGRILAERAGFFPADAVARVRYGGGIVISRGEAAVVEEIARLLREISVRPRVLPAAILESQPRGIRASRLDFHGEAVAVGYSGGRETAILADDIRGIQIHAMRPEAKEEPEAGREPVRLPVFSPRKEGQVSPRGLKVLDWIEAAGAPAPRFTLTLYAREPTGPVRLERDAIDYSVLGADKHPHSIDNFLLLAERLIESLPGLINRERVAGFLERLDPGEILLFKREEAQNFDRWIQAWIRLEDDDAVAGGTVSDRETATDT